MLVGEIGITPDRFRYGLRWWEIRSIIRGYNRRHRDLWSSNRWQTYNLMQAFCGGKALSEAGINSAKDLIKFPWDTDRLPISFDDVQTIVAEIEAVNAHRATPPPESSQVHQKSSEH